MNPQSTKNFSCQILLKLARRSRLKGKVDAGRTTDNGQRTQRHDTSYHGIRPDEAKYRTRKQKYQTLTQKSTSIKTALQCWDPEG